VEVGLNKTWEGKIKNRRWMKALLNISELKLGIVGDEDDKTYFMVLY